MRALLPALQSRNGQAAVNSLRVLIISGEPLSSQLWQDLQSVVSESTILNLYGSTEVRHIPSSLYPSFLQNPIFGHIYSEGPPQVKICRVSKRKHLG